MKTILTLVRNAKGKGGDRYEGRIPGEERNMVIYVPQTISRKSGIPAKSLQMILIREGEKEDAKE